MTAEPESKCPECGGPVKKLIGTGAGILFRGSGFYITDYRSSDYKKRAKEESGGGTSGAAGKEPGSTPPPAKTSDAKSGKPAGGTAE
jgi:predicted nucleic acid-binding Zn ribbon protein